MSFSRCFRVFSSEDRVAFRVSASSPVSSLLVIDARCERSPSFIFLATVTSSVMGVVMALLKKIPMIMTILERTSVKMMMVLNKTATGVRASERSSLATIPQSSSGT